MTLIISQLAMKICWAMSGINEKPRISTTQTRRFYKPKPASHSVQTPALPTFVIVQNCIVFWKYRKNNFLLFKNSKTKSGFAYRAKNSHLCSAKTESWEPLEISQCFFLSRNFSILSIIQVKHKRLFFYIKE